MCGAWFLILHKQVALEVLGENLTFRAEVFNFWCANFIFWETIFETHAMGVKFYIYDFTIGFVKLTVPLGEFGDSWTGLEILFTTSDGSSHAMLDLRVGIG